jgi:hypothetical protein
LTVRRANVQVSRPTEFSVPARVVRAATTLATHRSVYAFATGVRGGVRMMVVRSLRKTSSKAPMNWPAPSRIKNRIARS